MIPSVTVPNKDHKVALNKACEGNLSNPQCRVLYGTVLWKKRFAGRYRCGRYPEESVFIHWINPSNTKRSFFKKSLKSVNLFCPCDSISNYNRSLIVV